MKIKILWELTEKLNKTEIWSKAFQDIQKQIEKTNKDIQTTQKELDKEYNE